MMARTTNTSAPAHFAAAIRRAASSRFDNGRVLNIRPDPPDFRDRFYAPGLVRIELGHEAPQWLGVALRDQGDEGTCTGHALAAVIDIQNKLRGADINADTRASPRMLYEMARLHDEYPDDGMEGSSARGAIKGFFHNGVCREIDAPYAPWEPGWRMGVAHAKSARDLSLGAYLRLRHVLYDYHAALCEAGAVFVTSMVHPGWETDTVARAGGRIAFDTDRPPEPDGAHAFAIVGYDRDGFLVLNSWGPDWGGFDKTPGLGHWAYEDWQANVLDAWVLRLAVPSAKTFHKVGGYDRRHDAGEAARAAPARAELIGHYCHVEDGRFVRNGTYSNDKHTFAESADYIKSIANAPAERRYDHVLLYAHGGLTELEDAARHAALMAPVLKALRIYPVFFFWRTGAFGAIRDILFGQSNRAAERAGDLSDIGDWVLEKIARQLVRPIWSEMKDDAVRGAFDKPVPGIPRVDALAGDAGLASLAFVDALASQSTRAKGAGQIKLHIAGHSAGAILLSRLLQRWTKDGKLSGSTIATASLLAPACTIDLFENAFGPLLKGTASDIAIYALSKDRELGDTTGPYQKSILYLVSRALEQNADASVLGLESIALQAAKSGRVRTHITSDPDPVTNSPDHGGFDNDPLTLNHVLSRILSRQIDAKNGGFSDVHFALSAPKHGA